MTKLLFNIVLILAVVFGNKHHKHKSKSVHLPKSKSHVVQQGKWEPNREGGFHAKSSVCTSHFCYDSIRDETCDSTSTVCDDNAAFLHLGKNSRSLLQETESCSEAEGCGCLETIDTSYHCLAEKECDSDVTTNECTSSSDCSDGEYCADACCGYYQCLTLCCDSTTAEPIATTEEATTTDEPTTAEPTTAEPTTAEPTTAEPTTAEPTTAEPTTAEPTTAEPTTAEPTTAEPTTAEPTTAEPTTAEPTTAEPTTAEPTTAEPTTTPEPTTDEYPETTSDEYPETTDDTYPETTRGRLMNSHSIHKHGGDDDKPDIAPPQTADEDGVEPPPAAQNKLLLRLTEKSGQPQPIAGAPQEANEDGVEPPPAVEAEPEFSMSKKKKQRRKKKFGSVVAPPQPVEEAPQTADEDGVEPPPAAEEESNDDDNNDDDDDNDDNDDNNDNGSKKHKNKNSNVFPLVYFAPFLLVATIVGIAFLVKFYFDRNVYKNKLLSVDERNENVPLISKVATYQATN